MSVKIPCRICGKKTIEREMNEFSPRDNICDDCRGGKEPKGEEIFRSVAIERIPIFLSSTIDDLQTEREAIAKSINNRQELQAICSESFPATTLSPRQICLERVRGCYIYVGIFKNRYGFIPNNDNPEGLSVTALEYYEAKANNLSILIFLDKNATNIEEKLKDFLSKITDFDTGHFVKFYSNLNELVRLVSEAIDNEIRKGFMAEKIRTKQKQQIKELYDLPYFKKLKERQ